MSGVLMIPLDEIEYDPKLSIRQEIDFEETIPRYAEMLSSDPCFQFAECTVVRRNSPSGKPPYILIDGTHRYFGYRHADREVIPAQVESIPQSKWRARAVELNIAHGRPLTFRDRGKIVRSLEEDGWEIEKIAELIKVKVDDLKPFRLDAAKMRPITMHKPTPQLPRRRIPEKMIPVAETAPHERNGYSVPVKSLPAVKPKSAAKEMIDDLTIFIQCRTIDMNECLPSLYKLQAALRELLGEVDG